MALNNLLSGLGRRSKNAEAALQLMDEGNKLTEEGNQADGLEKFHQALELLDEDAHSTEMAACYSSIGNILRAKGDCDGALTALQKSVELRRRTQQEDDDKSTDTPATARALSLIAALHQLKGDHEAALVANEEALRVDRAVFGHSHTDTAQLIHNRGILLAATGDYEGALEQHHKALAIYLDQKDSIGMGTAYNGLGKVLWRQGQHNKAYEMLGSAQEMYLVAGLEGDHPLMANTLNNVALVMVDQGIPENALSVFKKALALRESRLGKEHPQTAETLADMGRAAHGMNKNDQALEYFVRALQIQRLELGPDNPKTIETQKWMEKCATTKEGEE